jgi:hypothetical protein
MYACIILDNFKTFFWVDASTYKREPKWIPQSHYQYGNKMLNQHSDILKRSEQNDAETTQTYEIPCQFVLY